MRVKYKKPLSLEELAALPDSEIDTSDIPFMGEEFWKGAKVTPPRIKPNVSLRVSAEVVEFFKSENPKGYTGRMAAVLTAYVDAHTGK